MKKQIDMTGDFRISVDENGNSIIDFSGKLVDLSPISVWKAKRKRMFYALARLFHRQSKYLPMKCSLASSIEDGEVINLFRGLKNNESLQRDVSAQVKYDTRDMKKGESNE